MSNETDSSSADLSSAGQSSAPKSALRSVLLPLLLGLGAIGGIVLLGWITVVMLDLKHLNTSGFTLP